MDDLRTLAAYRDLFPIAREVAFLNHAANGAIATPVAEAMIAHVREHAALGSRATAGWKVQQQRTRAKMAAFVGAAPGEIAMLTNTPQAIATIASGLDWRQGDRVVLADQEFPSNVLPWTSLARRGVDDYGGVATVFLRLGLDRPDVRPKDERKRENGEKATTEKGDHGRLRPSVSRVRQAPRPTRLKD